VTFVPTEARRRVVPSILSSLRPGRTTVALSVFQSVRSIPEDYFELAERGIYLVNWHTDDDMLFDCFSRRVGNQFNLNVTTYEPNVPCYEAIGAQVIASQWAGLPDCEFHESRRYAACFVGRMYGQRQTLVRRLRSECGDKVFLHDARAKPICEEAMISAYQSAWLAIDDPLAYDGKTLQIKARVFENASMGCVVATRPNRRLEQYYEPGREILFWESPADLVRMIEDARIHPEHYREMARHAYERTVREHLYEHRFTYLLRDIAERIG
jgi:spore maturation protein CgeB